VAVSDGIADFIDRTHYLFLLLRIQFFTQKSGEGFRSDAEPLGNLPVVDSHFAGFYSDILIRFHMFSFPALGLSFFGAGALDNKKSTDTLLFVAS